MKTHLYFSIFVYSLLSSFHAHASVVNQNLLISEIMYNPASASDDNWEWVELANIGNTSIDLSGWVADDGNRSAVSEANIASGRIDAGGTAVLYNAKTPLADFIAAWGEGINLVAVSQWSGLNNGGDKFGLWSSMTNYLDDNSEHARAEASVSYRDKAPWPIDDGAASIYLTNLIAGAGEPEDWALSVDGVDFAYASQPAGSNAGVNIGSPGELAAVPLPAAIWVFGSAIAALFGFSARSRSVFGHRSF